MRASKTRNCGTWTDGQFNSFLRSLLRRGTFRWLPRKQCILAARRPSESGNKRLKWEFQCAQCGQWFPQKTVAVDHKEACGSLNDLNAYVLRMYAEDPGAYQVLCKECHHTKTKEERKKS